MGLTNISWADFTFNPWIGCSKVKDSPACNNCYAWMMDVQRFSKTLGGGTKEKPISHWGPGAPRYRTSESAWRSPYKWNNLAICDACGQSQTICATAGNLGLCKKCGADKMRNPRVFSLSLGDWLDEEVPIEWLADMLKVIHECQNLTWLLLTKRPENWKDRCFEALHRWEEIRHNNSPTMDHDTAFPAWLSNWIGGHEAPANVHIGITAEDQFNYDRRLPHFLKIPAVSRFVSVEPLCGNINLHAGLCSHFNSERPEHKYGRFCTPVKQIHQVIVGGESGDHWRENILNLDATRDLYDQCRAAGVPFFMKQDSARLPGQRGRIPDDLWVQEFPI